MNDACSFSYNIYFDKIRKANFNNYQIDNYISLSCNIITFIYLFKYKIYEVY